MLVGPSSAGLPGIWKERSGKSTPWSEWYIWKTWAKTKREGVTGYVTSFFAIQAHCSSFETLHLMVMQQTIIWIKCSLFLGNANRVAFACWRMGSLWLPPATPKHESLEHCLFKIVQILLLILLYTRICMIGIFCHRLNNINHYPSTYPSIRTKVFYWWNKNHLCIKSGIKSNRTFSSAPWTAQIDIIRSGNGDTHTHTHPSQTPHPHAQPAADGTMSSSPFSHYTLNNTE